MDARHDPGREQSSVSLYIYLTRDELWDWIEMLCQEKGLGFIQLIDTSS